MKLYIVNSSVFIKYSIPQNSQPEVRFYCAVYQPLHPTTLRSHSQSGADTPSYTGYLCGRNAHGNKQIFK